MLAALLGGLLGFGIRRRPPAKPAEASRPETLTRAQRWTLAIAAISALACVISAAAAVLALICG